MKSIPEISIILPCLNEESAILPCLEEIKRTIKERSLSAEVIVVNNNSTDATPLIVANCQASFPELLLVEEKKEGYGSAYLKGLEIARGRYILMADADGTYNFSEIPLFISKLKEGNDLVVGNRFLGTIADKSMPWLHRYIGNPFLSFLVRLFFGVKIGDIHCGIRAISKEALGKIVLYTGGMEFASEMVIKAAKAGLKITEIPVEYGKRIGRSKLHSFADGWRHLRFILLYSPLVLFFLPGALLFLLGLVLLIVFYFFEPMILGIQLYTHPMFLFSVMMILGYQLMLFGGFSKTYAITHLGDTDPFIESLFRRITIEKTGLAGIIISIIGAVIYLLIFIKWARSGFGSLSEIKNSIVALTLLVLGIQTFFSAFMFSILGIKEK